MSEPDDDVSIDNEAGWLRFNHLKVDYGSNYDNNKAGLCDNWW